MVDRYDEAENIGQAADLGIALGPLYCEPAAGILLTRAVDTVSATPDVLAACLGDVLGRLHASKNAFRGELDPGRVIGAQLEALGSGGTAAADVARLKSLLADLQPFEPAEREPRRVPSHGDPSPGNCLMTSDRLWLIDWEYSAMAKPSWDIAYASLEHGFSRAQERELLEAYRQRAGDRLRPTQRELQMMKIKCDVVSALWGLEQLSQGSDKTDFHAFARARLDRAVATARAITG